MTNHCFSNPSSYNPIKHLTVGVGGRRCPCCFPAPGSKARKAAFRSAKRRFAYVTRKEIAEDRSETG